MTISARVIADSVSEHQVRITTMLIRYPRFIHAEFMTHRVFSRNASSSRAIPVKKLIEDVINDPVYPSFWGKNQKGMQAHEECNEKVVIVFGIDERKFLSREEAWWLARAKAIDFAKAFDDAGYHKQIVNRLLEPFSHINVVVTATEWSNFYALRRHEDAQPEIRELADRMWEAQQNSIPLLLRKGEWHLPFVSQDEILGFAPNFDNPIKLSVARCARTSYLTHEGKKPKVDEDLALYDRLLSSVPLHASPAEHQATPDPSFMGELGWAHRHLHGNFTGWIQYRKTLPGECQ